jgi:hypothetical protein
MKYKWCKYCNKNHPATRNFWSFRKNGTPSGCRKKNREDSLKYHKNNKERSKERLLKTKYNLTLQQFKEMMNNADCKCAICGNMLLELSNANVDHDHSTGKVRGILCNNCNLGLGRFKDNLDLLLNAIKYLCQTK